MCRIGQNTRCSQTGCEFSKVFGAHCHGEKINNIKIPTFEEVYKVKENHELFPIPKSKKKQLKAEHPTIDKIDKPKWFVPAYDSAPLTKATPRRNLSPKRWKIYEKSKGICYLCKERLYPNGFTIDHVIPLSKGGTNADKNLRAVHEACNLRKGDSLIPDELENPLKVQSQDDWIKKIKVI